MVVNLGSLEGGILSIGQQVREELCVVGLWDMDTRLALPGKIEAWDGDCSSVCLGCTLLVSCTGDVYAVTFRDCAQTHWSQVSMQQPTAMALFSGMFGLNLVCEYTILLFHILNYIFFCK